MTAYNLFKKVHYIGKQIRHLWTANKDYSPKEYIKQSFNDLVDEYTVDCAGSNGIMLSYGVANNEVHKLRSLQDIKVFEGYWLCHYDGHTDNWMLSHYIFKEEAMAKVKEWHKYYIKHQDWFWIVKVGDLLAGQ